MRLSGFSYRSLRIVFESRHFRFDPLAHDARTPSPRRRRSRQRRMNGRKKIFRRTVAERVESRRDVASKRTRRPGDTSRSPTRRIRKVLFERLVRCRRRRCAHRCSVVAILRRRRRDARSSTAYSNARSRISPGERKTTRTPASIDSRPCAIIESAQQKGRTEVRPSWTDPTQRDQWSSLSISSA